MASLLSCYVRAMDVLMVTAELAPYLRATETADAVAALSQALAQAGHRVTLALPRFAGLEESGLMVARRLSELPCRDADPITVYDGQLPSGVGIVLFESAQLEPRDGVYGDGKDYADNPLRFATLARAAVALCEQRAQQGKRFDVVHAHDWPGAMMTLVAGAPPIVLTIHNPERQGSLTWKELDALNLPLDEAQRERLKAGARANVLRAGVLNSKVVTTVSPSVAAELRDVETYGALASALTESGEEVFGVLGGVDYSVYNPSTDTALSTRYDAEAPEKKGNSKTALCRELELELEPERPLVVYAAPIDKDFGAHWVASILPQLLKLDVNLLVVGSGTSKALLRQFGAAKLKRMPNYRFIESSSPAEQRKALAAADIALCPGQLQRTGLAARVAQRYGAVPVACSLSGNRDAIVDCDANLQSGTGFLFAPEDAEQLLSATERAVAASHVPGWGRLRQRIMRLDLGWEGPARRYAQLYRMALKA